MSDSDDKPVEPPEGWLHAAGQPRRAMSMRTNSPPLVAPVVWFPCGYENPVLGGVQVTIEPMCFVEHSQEMANAVADAIMEHIPRVVHLRNAARDARVRADHAEHRLLMLTTPRREYMGALCVRPDEHRGGCWLMGRDADWSSFGFYFPSMADLWRENPDLRPVWWGEDQLGSVLHVESQPITVRDA